MSRGNPPSGPGSDNDFLRRWSKRKHEAAADKGRSPDAVETLANPPQPSTGEAPIAEGAPPALPDLESLTPESDFTPFMRRDVDADLQRKALKTLFQDPRFNVMDGLDVYIDDYSKPDPLPEGWLEKMNQVARLGEYREAEEVAPKEPGDEEIVPELSAPIAPPTAPAAEPPADTGAQAPLPPQVPES